MIIIWKISFILAGSKLKNWNYLKRWYEKYHSSIVQVCLNQIKKSRFHSLNGTKWDIVELISSQKNWDLIPLCTISSSLSAIVHVSCLCLSTVLNQNIVLYDIKSYLNDNFGHLRDFAVSNKKIFVCFEQLLYYFGIMKFKTRNIKVRLKVKKVYITVRVN